MLELLGYLVVAYGVARLLQTSIETDNSWSQVFGYLGVAVLVVLGLMLHDQASSVGSVLGG